MYEPLVSVGIPTYNRPEGLKRTLEHVLLQTYRNIEIIVSNNASTDPLVDQVIDDFVARDKRIRYFKQPENKGPLFNFKFVSRQATGDLFMWAADDDYFESNDLLEHLVVNCRGNLLAFPDINLFNKEGDVNLGVMGPVYKDCHNTFEYLQAWSKSGVGYPIYGLFNVSRFKECDVEFKFDDDLIYYTEGTFLHRIFIKGGVRFVPGVFIRIDTNSSRPDVFTLIDCFSPYCNRMLQLYLAHRFVKRSQIVRNVFLVYRKHFQQLFKRSREEKGFFRSLLHLFNKPVLLLFVVSSGLTKVRNKTK